MRSTEGAPTAATVHAPDVETTSDCKSSTGRGAHGAGDSLECPDELEPRPELISVSDVDDIDIDIGACSAFEGSDDDDLELWDVFDDPALTVEDLTEPVEQPQLRAFPAGERTTKECLRDSSSIGSSVGSCVSSNTSFSAALAEVCSFLDLVE